MILAIPRSPWPCCRHSAPRLRVEAEGMRRGRSLLPRSYTTFARGWLTPGGPLFPSWSATVPLRGEGPGGPLPPSLRKRGLWVRVWSRGMLQRCEVNQKQTRGWGKGGPWETHPFTPLDPLSRSGEEAEGGPEKGFVGGDRDAADVDEVRNGKVLRFFWSPPLGRRGAAGFRFAGMWSRPRETASRSPPGALSQPGTCA